MRLLDVDIEASCVCAEDHHGRLSRQNESTVSQKYVRPETVTPQKKLISETPKEVPEQQSPEKKANLSGIAVAVKTDSTPAYAAAAGKKNWRWKQTE